MAKREAGTATATSEMESEEGLTILGALAQLKDEIYQLQERGISQGQRPMFLIKEGELELKLVVKKERKAEGSLKAAFKLYVADSSVAASASGSNASESVQTLKIKFEALGQATAPVQTGASNVSGAKMLEPGRPIGIDLPVVTTDTQQIGKADKNFGF